MTELTQQGGLITLQFRACQPSWTSRHDYAERMQERVDVSCQEILRLPDCSAPGLPLSEARKLP